MAKKSSRNANISAQALERARTELAQNKTANTLSTPAGKKDGSQQVVRSFKKMMTREELSQEYGYVLQDMQSMAILAACLFIGMIVVSVAIL
jgi:hypothetical protein